MAENITIDLTELQGIASERLLVALQKINEPGAENIHAGLHEITSLTKRTDDVTECLDILLRLNLVPKVLSYLQPELLGAYEGEASVRGVAVVPVKVQMGEAIQLAALTAMGELIWQRDTSSEVRPVMLEAGGVQVLTKLLAETPSERVRLKTLVLARRVLYEVGSTSAMDPAAIEAAQECDVLGVLVQLLGRVVCADNDSITMDTLEGVTYLLQRMQACMLPEQQEAMNLAAHLRTAAGAFTQLMQQRGTLKEALEMSLLGVRELCWDDHNNPLEPAISQFADAGAFESIAALFAPAAAAGGASQGQQTQEATPTAKPILTEVAEGTVSNQMMGAACQLLQRLTAAKPGFLPQSLEIQVPRLFHQVIHQLVDQLDHSLNVPDKQETALHALRKLLVTDHSQHVPKVAAEAAEAEGVPARLLLVARSGEAFGGPVDGSGECVPDAMARSAAALLAELAASTATLAAEEGRPAQAAESLAQLEPIVAPLVGQHANNVDACRTFCRMLCALSVMRWDVPDELQHIDDMDSDIPEPRVAPPEEEQYALSSRLVTLVGQVAQGLTGLLQGGYVVKKTHAGMHSHMHMPTRRAGSSPLPSAAQIADVVGGGVDPAHLPGQEQLQLAMTTLQRASMMIHDLGGLKQQTVASSISRHNIDALFVHGTFQALVQQTHYWYTHKRAQLRAQARAEAEAAANETSDSIADDPGPSISGYATPEFTPASRSNSMVGTALSFTSSRASSMSANANPLLHPLLNQDTGVLELFKELVRDCADARLRLRDIGALPMFARMLGDNPRDNLLVSMQFNLARSEALQAALKQEGCIALMDKVLSQAPQNDGAHHEVRRLLALCVLGLVASDDSVSGDPTDADCKRAATLMAKHDIAGFMERILREACQDGRYVISTSTSAWPFTLEPAAYTVGCLARVDDTARKLAARNIPSFLFSALNNEHGAAAEPALRIVRAILTFARLPDLRAGLLALGAMEALMPFTEVEDQRTCDAARGCLLQLGELPDVAAKVALQATLPLSLQPALSQPLPSPQERGACGIEPLYDVLICYKRTDAQAMARMVHNALVLRGVGCLLDYEYQPNLGDVEQVVSRARNLLVILTDNCLTSPRCLAELQAAAAYDINVIMVVKEGARWGDSNGNMLSMPPQQTIKALRPELHKLFALKAIHHRDEHYAYFVNQLLKRIKTAPPAPRPATALHRNMSMLGRGQKSDPPLPFSVGPSNMKASTTGGVEGRLSGSKALPSSLGGDLSRRQSMSGMQGHRASISGSRLDVPQVAAAAAVQVNAGAATGPVAISAADFQALQSVLSTQTAMLAELAREVAAVKASSAGLNGLQNVVAGLQTSVSNLAAEFGGLRREISAEVAASGRHVIAEVQSGTTSVRQAIAAEVSSQSSALNSVKTDVAALLSMLCGDLTGNLSTQMKSLAADVSEVRRGLADCVSGVVAVQSQVRMLVGSKSELSAAAVNCVSGTSSASSVLARTCPPILTSTHSEGTVFHSAPVRANEEHGHDPSISAPLQFFTTAPGHSMSQLPLHATSTSCTGTLPPLCNSNAGHTHREAGNISYRNPSMNRESEQRSRTSPSKSATLGQIPHTPQVGGFQGARIAAMQNKINALPRGRQ